MELINISICLTDLLNEKDKIKQAANGKTYINLVCLERKQIGIYGETHSIIVSQTKEERELNINTVFVGFGKKHVPKAVTFEDIDNLPSATDVEYPY